MHLVESIAYRGEKPWHGLGNRLEAGQPIEVWRDRAGMDWSIEDADVRYVVGNQGLGVIQSFPSHKVLYRSDTKAPLAVVSKRFQVVQPGEILEFYRDLTEVGGFELETAGVLREGRKFWALARTGQSVTLPMTLPTKGGTIDFVANNVGIEGDAEGILATLRKRLEKGATIEETEVDSMCIDGVQLVDGVEVPFRTYGFASAAGGVGQRFYAKYYADADPNPRTIVKVVANTVMSAPIAMTPLSKLPFGQWATYAKEVFAPTKCKVTLDGMVLPGNEFTGVHVASMSINLGNVLRFFGKADQPGLMNAIVGTPTAWGIIRNLPRMLGGQEMRGRDVLDRPCREMILEANTSELLGPIIDGEYYRNVKKLEFRVGPRVRIPKVVAPKAA